MTDPRPGQNAPSIVITGAASGIGASTARLFAGNGWQVGLMDRDAGALQSLAQELGADAIALEVDVLDRAGLEKTLAQFADQAGGITVLFNSAGLLDMRPFKDAPVDRLNAMLDVNIKGVIHAISAAMPYLAQQSEARIVTMSSAAAIYGVPDLAVYSASKFAVRGLTEALNIELEGQGIWVCDVMVGYVDTPMLSQAENTAKSVEIAGVNATPDMVADTVFQAVQGRQVHWFVREDDQAAAQFFDLTPIEERRDLIRPATGY